MRGLASVGLQRAFAVFVGLHGLAHLVDPESSTGFEPLAPTAWLAIALLMLGAGVMLWFRTSLAREATIVTVALSTILCATSLRGAALGLGIDIVLLILLTFWPWQVVGRPSRLGTIQ